jgi:hypothetical protein
MKPRTTLPICKANMGLSSTCPTCPTYPASRTQTTILGPFRLLPLNPREIAPRYTHGMSRNQQATKKQNQQLHTALPTPKYPHAMSPPRRAFMSTLSSTRTRRRTSPHQDPDRMSSERPTNQYRGMAPWRVQRRRYRCEWNEMMVSRGLAGCIWPCYLAGHHGERPTLWLDLCVGLEDACVICMV